MARLIGDALIAHVREGRQQMLMKRPSLYMITHQNLTAQATVARVVVVKSKSRQIG